MSIEMVMCDCESCYDVAHFVPCLVVSCDCSWVSKRAQNALADVIISDETDVAPGRVLYKKIKYMQKIS